MILNNIPPTFAPFMATLDSTTNPSDPAVAAPELMPLAALCSGEARVVRVEAEPADATRLMALGICVGRRVQIVKGGDPLIVRVVGARVGLCARLAAGVIVAAVDDLAGATTAA